MVFTPVLSRNWDDADSFTIDGYTRAGGYQALAKALLMDPDALIQLVKDSGAARPRRRRLPDWPEVGLHPAG